MANSARFSPPSRRALLVVDVQNDYDGGRLAIQYPRFSDSIVEIGRAMDAAAMAGVQIVVIKMLLPAGAPVFARGSWGSELHAEVKSRKCDHYVEKTWPSAFTGTDLEDWLKARGIDTVTVVGYMTHNCDLATIVHAFHMGFAVELLSDATGSVPYANSAGMASAEDIHRVMGVVLQARFAAVMTTTAWIDALASHRLPARDTIHASYQRALVAMSGAA